MAARRLILLLALGAATLILLPVAARFAQGPVPPEVTEYFAPEQVERARALARANALPVALQMLAPIGALIWLCFSERGRRLLARLETGSRVWVSVLRVSFVALATQQLARMPFDFWTYQNLRAWGISRAAPGVWLGDYARRFLVEAAPLLVVFLVVYFLMRRIRLWWVPGLAVAAAVIFFINLIYPVYVLPLFYQVAPVRDQAVVATMTSLADRAGVAVGSMNEMVTSQKLSTLNARVSGLGPTKQVLIWDTALAQLNGQQLEVLLAHELAHAVYRDLLINTIVMVGLIALQMYLIFWFLQTFGASGALGLRLPPPPRALALVLLLVVMLGVYAEIGMNVVSRLMEERADRYAIELTGRPETFVSLTKTVYITNVADPDPPALLEFLRDTHPSPMRRIRMGKEYGGS